MKIKTHLRVAKLAARQYALARRAAAAFYFGTIVPDIMPFYHPHYYKTSGNYVFRKLAKIARKHTTYSFFWRGVMAHYVTDFCCSAHANGLGNVKDHVSYEISLEKYSKQHLLELKKMLSEKEVFFDLHEAINSYACSGRGDYATDFCAAVQACVALLYCYTPIVDIRKRAITLDLNLLAYHFDGIADALTDSISDTLSDVKKTNHGKI